MVIDYLKEFASLFHSIWGAGIKLVDEENETYTRGMMAFVSCVRNIIENSLICIGVEPKQQLIKDAE